MKLLSLFDGSGGFPLAGAMCGIIPVADFRGQRAGKILFERQGLRGDITQSRTQGEGTAGNVKNGIGAADRKKCCGFPLGFRPENTRLYKECATTLCNGTRAGFCNGVVYAVENHPADSRVNIDDSGKCQTLTSRMGTGGGNVPLVMEPVAYNGENITSPLNKTNPQPGEPCHTLGTDSRNYLVYSIDRAAYNQGINAQYDIGIDDSGTAHTLVAKGMGAVCYGIGNGQADQTGLSKEKVGCLNCMHDQQAVLIDREPYYIVRRLTPLECCRLQGFPDWWCDGLETPKPTEEDLKFWREVFETHRKIVTGASKPKTDKQIIKWLKDPYSDSAIYKMWGNGIALPNVLFVMQGIAKESEAENEDQ